MSRFFKIFISIAFIFSSSPFVYASNNRPLNTHFAAKTAKDFFNRHKTIGGVIKSLSTYYTVEEIHGLKKLLKESGVKLSQKLPKAKASGNAFRVGKMKITFNKNRTINLKGYVYKPGSMPLDRLLKSMVTNSKVTNNSSNFSLFPKAHATFLGGAGSVFGSMGMYFMGVAVAAAVAAGAVVVYASSEVWQRVKDGDAECVSGVFKVRKRKRTKLLRATHEDVILSHEAVSEILGKDIKKCTDSHLAELKEKVKKIDYKEMKKKEQQERSSGLE